MADLNQYTVNIVNAEELYVQGKKIEAFDLGALTSLNTTYGIGIRTDFTRLTLDISGTDAMRIPMGTTAQQPSTTIFDATHPYNGNTGRELDGCIRYNITTTKFESWSSVANSWVDLGGVSSNDRQEIITADETNGIIFKTDNTNRMQIDNNGNIGINTTPSSSYKLNVDGKLRCTNLNINGTDVTATATKLNYVDITDLGTSQANKAVTTNSAGNVGIGIAPLSRLHLYTADEDACILTIETDGRATAGVMPESVIEFKTNDGSPTNPTASETTYPACRIVGTWKSGYITKNNSQLKLQTHHSESTVFDDTMILTGGRVGIRREPGSSYELDVNGDINFSGNLYFNGTQITATATELNYVDGVTSSIQSQINSKQATITGATSEITSGDLTASRALISNGSGKVAVSPVTSTELGYLDGVSSSIQAQIAALKAKNETLESTLTNLLAELRANNVIS